MTPDIPGRQARRKNTCVTLDLLFACILVTLLDSMVDLTLVTADGKTTQIGVGEDETIENVKAIVEVELGIPILQQQLWFNGNLLGNTSTVRGTSPFSTPLPPHVCFIVWLACLVRWWCLPPVRRLPKPDARTATC